MPLRVDYEDVIEILDTELEESMVWAFIETASIWVDENLVSACPQLSDAMLAQIEKYLAAHLTSARDPQMTSSSMGDVSETYQRASEMTDYLRIAMSLDPCGIVKRVWSGTGVRLRWRVGTGYAEEASSE